MIPPYVADIQIVIIPIISKKRNNDILQKCRELNETLTYNGLRVKLDESNHNPSWKYNYWETLGVPLRIDNNSIIICKRTDFTKHVIEINDDIVPRLKSFLDGINRELYNKAYNELMCHIKTPFDSK